MIHCPTTHPTRPKSDRLGVLTAALTRATVEGGDWSFVGLPGANLNGVSIRGVRMREADLTGARLERATLRDADLSGAWLHRAVLTRCDLRGSELPALDPRTVELAGAMIDPYQAVVIAGALGLDVCAD